MIDGEGHALITDFGLAVPASDMKATLAGTPQYMAPEQLTGEPASVKSDLYAFGLVLFELFTGRRAHDARTLDELRRLHESGPVTTPSSVLHDIDPAVERVITRCLDRNPARRPLSALAVAAALPGADPLADAIAAGETPSPEMLAAAGEVDALPVAYGLIGIACVVAGVIAAATLAPRATEARLVPLDRPALLLADRAEQIFATLGYTEPGGDVAYGFAQSQDYRSWMARNERGRQRWNVLSTGFPVAIQFWYRTSPRPLVPQSGGRRPSFTDPPLTLTDSRRLVLDTKGRLISFQTVPAEFDATEAVSAPRWEPLFEAAGLSATAFQSVAPQWTPATFADTRAAWEGTLPDRPTMRVRVEAAAYRGRPVSFSIVWPWTTAARSGPRQRNPTDRFWASTFIVAGMVMMIGAIVLARHHVRAGRGDTRAATRLAVFVIALHLLAWLIGNHHVADTAIESDSLRRLLKDAVLTGAALWILYVALEPYARKFWPGIMLGWSRLLSGHIRDSRVGRDVLVGLGFGMGWVLLFVARFLVPQAFGHDAPRPLLGSVVSTLGGLDSTIELWLTAILEQIIFVLGVAFLFVALRLVTRRTWIAIPIGMYVLFTFWSSFGQAAAYYWIELTLEVSIVALFTFVLIRFGLLAAAIAAITFRLGTTVPLTLDLSHWSATPSNWTLAGVIALALFGYYASRGGRPLLGAVLPD